MSLASTPWTVVIWTPPGGSSPGRRLTASILKPAPSGARSPRLIGAGSPNTAPNGRLRSGGRCEVSCRLGAALRRKQRGDDRLVRVHVGDGRDADARRLDDVDGVDADARADVVRRRSIVPWHVGRDDGGDDAAVPGPDAAALPPERWQAGSDASRSADAARRRGLLLRVDRARN